MLELIHQFDFRLFQLWTWDWHFEAKLSPLWIHDEKIDDNESSQSNETGPTQLVQFGKTNTIDEKKAKWFPGCPECPPRKYRGKLHFSRSCLRQYVQIVEPPRGRCSSQSKNVRKLLESSYIMMGQWFRVPGKFLLESNF